MGDTMQQRLTQDLTQFLASLPEDDRIKAINEIRMAIHQVSPFREEPVDCVLWVKNSQLMPNDYKEIEIMLDYENKRIDKLGQLTPEWWI